MTTEPGVALGARDNLGQRDQKADQTRTAGSMPNAFVRKIAAYASLDDGEMALLEQISGPTRRVDAHRDLIKEGDKPGPVFLVLEGWACRYKVLPDGGRQIVAFLMPGDCCDLHVGMLEEMDHGIGTLTPCQVAVIPRQRIEALIVATPNLTQAFWRAQLIDEGVLRAWIVSMGRRDSLERVAHLMLELYIRMRNVGQVSGDTCRMPLTQTVLADALGLTPVHVNRVLRTLRERNAMTLVGGALEILDPNQLVRIAGFDENYLHRRAKYAA